MIDPCVFILKLQAAYARGDLKPGLNVEIDGEAPRRAINNIVSEYISIHFPFRNHLIHLFEKLF